MNGSAKIKPPELASLPDVISECRGGGKCAQSEHEGQAQNTRTISKITSFWFTDEVGLVFIPWNCFVCARNLVK